MLKMARKSTAFLYALIGTVVIVSGNLDLDAPPGTVYGPFKHNVTIPCGLSFPADEPLELLMWYKESTYIVYKGQDGVVHNNDAVDKDKFDIMGADNSLLVSLVETGDMASYKCKKTYKTVINGSLKFVEEEHKTELIVQDVPSPPGVPTISEVTSRECVVSWQKSQFDNNSPILNYIIYVKNIDQDWEESRGLLVNGETTSITIRDLTPFVYYQIRIIAKNALGKSLPSSSSGIFNTKGEPPSMPPADVKLSSPASSKINISWKLPDKDHINGILEGFEVKYQIVNDVYDHAFVVEESKRSATIEGLHPFTNYSVSILLYNDIDKGPAAVDYIRTAEGVPDKPRITHLSDQTFSSFIVNWEAPTVENGRLKNYQLQWIHNNTYKTRIITGHLTQPMRATINDLEPYTEYQLRVRAETGGGYSEYSDLYPALTDVKGASEPTIRNLTVLSPHAIFIHWQQPLTFYKKIDSYLISYSTQSENRFAENVMVPGTDNKKVIANLPTNNMYQLKIAAVTQSIYAGNYMGDFDIITFELKDPNMVVRVRQASTNTGIIAGTIVGFVFIIASVLIFVGCKSMTCRKYTRSLYYRAVPTNSQSPQSTVVFPKDTIDSGGSRYQEISVADFLRHNRDMHANSDDGFSAQFEDIAIQTQTDLPADNSDLPDNKHKNRYVNISAYDHSRVVLQQIPGRPKSSDYINANFISGYNKPQGYVATQGPLPHTFADFWRMVWEQNSIVIVMITNLVERGRPKCDMYWPSEGAETYGSVVVKHLNTISRAHYTVRLFSLKSCKNKKKQVSERIVYQYHYTEWPDHGVPEFTLPVLKFIQKSSSDNPPGAGPIIIHCSAGVGRTGTYILIESMIKQIKDRGTINIPAFLLHIRTQRKSLVQTEEQYMLIHDAIAEYILTQGDTEVKECDLTKHLAELTNQVNGEMNRLEIQYNLVTSFQPNSDDMYHALRNMNVCKNRNLDLVPAGVKRVILPMIPGEEGSDYINATYLQGYHKTNEFIITQHPLEQTMEDFWRMVWDQNASVIVQLSCVDDQDFKSYWPAQEHTLDIAGSFKLTYREEDERKKYTIKEFLLQSNQDDYILMTRVVTPKEAWPSSCEPLHQVFDLIDDVQELHKHNDMGPVIVIDSYGGMEAATFCALWSIFDQLQNDKTVNVYQLSKLYHLKRPSCISSKENYLYLYQAAESLSKEQIERDKQSSPGSIRLHLGSKKNGTMPRSVTINSKIENSKVENSKVETDV